MKKRVNMVEGNIYKSILLFSIPLLLGNIFQLLYNTVDSIVVGRFVGKLALSAVGTSTPVINLLISFFLGLATGAGVVISRAYGGKKEDELQAAVHTFVTFAFIVGVVLMVFGYFFAPNFLHLINTGPDIFDDAATYLRIMFLGSIFLVFYNSGTGILNAVGDSKKPLYFLMCSSILNIILDLVFVIYLKMGVAGVAWATVIAQGTSAILVFLTLLKTSGNHRLHLDKLGVDKYTLFKIVQIGIPAALQSSIVSASNFFVQSYVNGFGSDTIAAFSAANKVDSFMGMPLNSLALAATTFTGQNMGSRRYDRVLKGVRACVLMSVASILAMSVFIFFNAEYCVSIFNQDPEVKRIGAMILKVFVSGYWALGFHQVYSGALRGAGHSSPPMVISVLCFCAIRFVIIMLSKAYFYDQIMIGFMYTITWVLAATITTVYYHFHNPVKNVQD